MTLSLQHLNFQLNYIKEAAKKLGATKVIVFGSQIKGTARQDSDIDVCLVKQNDDSHVLDYKKKFWSELRKTGHTYGFGIDLHVYSQEKYEQWLQMGHPFIEEIEKGHIIYAD